MEKPKNRETVHSNGSKKKSDNAGDKTPATIWINIRGTRRQGDADGKLATILDCATAEGIIPDDSVKFLDRVFTTFEKSREPGIDIIIVEEE